MRFSHTGLAEMKHMALATNQSFGMWPDFERCHSLMHDVSFKVRVRKSFGNVTWNDTIVGEAVLPWNSVRHRGSQRLQVPLSCNMMQVGELSLRLQARRLEASVGYAYRVTASLAIW